MKNFIYNYYGFYVDIIEKNKDGFIFNYNNDYYMVSEVQDITSFSEVYEYVLKNNIESFKVVNNKDNKIYSDFNDKKFILLKLHGVFNYEYKYRDFSFYNISNKSGLDWGKLWSDKIDYYEHQIRELGIKHQTLLNTFGFFCGMAENAIQYYNLTMSHFNEPNIVSLCHKRVKYPCLLIDYINPINFVFDYSVRDISEYVKSYLFYKDYDVEFIIDLLSKTFFNNKMFNLLYSRLLYPSFYFDIFDEIILNKKSDNIVIEAVDITNRYVGMLQEIYYIYSKKYKMFKIEWLDKIKM